VARRWEAIAVAASLGAAFALSAVVFAGDADNVIACAISVAISGIAPGVESSFAASEVAGALAAGVAELLATGAPLRWEASTIDWTIIVAKSEPAGIVDALLLPGGGAVAFVRVTQTTEAPDAPPVAAVETMGSILLPASIVVAVTGTDFAFAAGPVVSAGAFSFAGVVAIGFAGVESCCCRTSAKLCV
jgi:hypothetical protein